MTAENVGDSVGRVAARVRRWRGEAGYSLQELANRSGVSPSTIHKIEHGQTVPTIAVVLKLAAGLGRRPTELFDDESARSTTVLVRGRERNALVTPRGARVESLAGAIDATEIGIWRVVHPPGFSFGEDTLSHLNGELILFLESGALHVTVGDLDYELEAGDSLHFKASSPYSWENRSASPACALIVGNITDAVRPALLSHMRSSFATREPEMRRELLQVAHA